jgi:Holliday junction resolvasome RuvABC DNA-binding subunit
VALNQQQLALNQQQHTETLNKLALNQHQNTEALNKMGLNQQQHTEALIKLDENTRGLTIILTNALNALQILQDAVDTLAK